MLQTKLEGKRVTGNTRHPVIEVFGPTIQGEGILVGTPVYFVRFGGCDYRCTWCDTMYAVLPKEVKQNSAMMLDADIVDALDALSGSPGWVVLSGGNPAIQRLDTLCDALHAQGYKLTVETQGTIYNSWLDKVDAVTVSPKPPSSGNTTSLDDIDAFRAKFEDDSTLSYKVVVFDEADVAYLRDVVAHLGTRYPLFLSIGTDIASDGVVELCDKWRYWAEYVANDSALGGVRILAQCHVLLWGQQRGV